MDVRSAHKGRERFANQRLDTLILTLPRANCDTTVLADQTFNAIQTGRTATRVIVFLNAAITTETRDVPLERHNQRRVDATYDALRDLRTWPSEPTIRAVRRCSMKAISDQSKVVTGNLEPALALAAWNSGCGPGKVRRRILRHD